MGSHKSKEDDVSKISTSIFITNFPVTFSAKDLFNACKQYGYVVDAYIPIKRSKDGKREIVWVEIEGIPFKLWSNNTFKRIASKWGDLLHIDDQDENCFHSEEDVHKDEMMMLIEVDSDVDEYEVLETCFEVSDRSQNYNKTMEELCLLVNTGESFQGSIQPFFMSA
ncbi:nucleotide-binding alpha-beta plait domain-containing protein [Tanacetum coccineum]